VTTRVAGNPQQVYARIAGFMYLFLIVLGLTSLAITSRIEVGRNVLEVSRSVAASEQLYRIGLGFGLAESLCALLLAVGLYVTLRPVDSNLATMALLYRLVEVVTGAAGSVIGFATLQVYIEAHHADPFNTNQLNALADLSSAAGGAAGAVAIIAFSVGSTIFFCLFLRSGYIPRIMSAWGIFASPVFGAVGVINLILPQFSGVTTYCYLPIAIAEISTGLWLLIRGVKLQPGDESVAAERARATSTV
jgi:uncharacterized protein DUF4386